MVIPTLYVASVLTTASRVQVTVLRLVILAAVWPVVYGALVIRRGVRRRRRRTSRRFWAASNDAQDGLFDAANWGPSADTAPSDTDSRLPGSELRGERDPLRGFDAPRSSRPGPLIGCGHSARGRSQRCDSNVLDLDDDIDLGPGSHMDFEQLARRSLHAVSDGDDR